MKRAFQSERSKTLLSYFLLAVAVIVAYKAILGIDGAISFLKRLLSIVSPFITGFLIAYILNIPCGGIQKLLARSKNTFLFQKRKAISIFITYILLFLILFLVLYLVIPSVYRSISLFAANYQTYYNRAQEFIRYINDLNILNINISMDSVITVIRDFGLEKLPSSLTALSGVSNAMFGAFLAFISSIYILFEKEKFKVYLCRLIKVFSSGEVYRAALKYARVLNNNFKQYIYTQTIDGCILGTISTIELSLLGSPYALILGIMLGFVNYIPYFGAIIGSIIAIIIVAFTQGLTRAAITAIVLLVTQQIDGNIIQPRLMGGSFSLSPLLIIISITIGGAFYGVLGMLMVIPIVAVIKNILDEIIEYYARRKPPEPDENRKTD